MNSNTIEGELDIIWPSRPHRGGTGQYRVLFISTHGDPGAIRQQRLFTGEESLRNFLRDDIMAQTMSKEKAERAANEWLQELHEKGSINRRPIVITQALFDRLTVR
jgi:hypothetical protein